MGGVLTDEALKASIDSSGSTSSLHYLRMPASMPEASVSEWVKVAQQVATADRMKTGRTQEIILTDATVATVQIGSSSIPRVDAVDVSSYQDWMTQADFTKLKRLGVSTVIVKVTEGSSYTNSAAKTQIAYAKAAGLKVDVYDYIRFTSASQAQAEARYTASAMEGLGLSKATLIFADIEENSVPAADLTNYWSALNAAGYRNHASTPVVVMPKAQPPLPVLEVPKPGTHSIQTRQAPVHFGTPVMGHGSSPAARRSQVVRPVEWLMSRMTIKAC